MSKLTMKQRNKLSASTFGLPGKRAYPMPDKAHAIAAKSRTAQFATPAQKAVIDAKANGIINRSRAARGR